MNCMTVLPPSHWLGWLAAALSCGAALAQPLVDPTRPPSDHLPATGSSAPAPASNGLRLVISSPQRQLALYNGQLLRRGDELDGGTLLQVDARQVLLRKEDQHQPLSMHPQVRKIPRPAPAQTATHLQTRETR